MAVMPLGEDATRMEPLLIAPSHPRYDELLGLASDLVEASSRLDAALSAATARAVDDLVEGANCFYSNLIEGHSVPLAEIRVAQQAAGGSPGVCPPGLALAHVESARWARSQSVTGESIQPLLLELHRRFCSRLPSNLRTLADGSSLMPGQLRRQPVQVGHHHPPRYEVLQELLARFAKVYGSQLSSAAPGGIHRLRGILASMAAHHRFAWIHPFQDGNGRIARLVLSVMLGACGIPGTRLWSISRGLAKSVDHYRHYLAAADQPLMDEFDGRGKLSETGLVAFCVYALQTSIDQAQFMGSMFSGEHFRRRVEHYFRTVRLDLKPESVHLYLHAFMMGEFARMEAGRLTGLPERTARNVLGALLDEGLLISDSPKGKVGVGFPMHALGVLLPNLYPAGDLDLLGGLKPLSGSVSELPRQLSDEV